jgi:hypothetical protein
MFRLGNFKIESKLVRDICFLKFRNTVKVSNVATDDFCKVKYHLNKCFNVSIPFYSGHSVFGKENTQLLSLLWTQFHSYFIFFLVQIFPLVLGPIFSNTTYYSFNTT